MGRRHVGVAVASLAATLALAGCGTSADGRIAVVASTNVWGSVARAVGGTAVRVTSVIDDPAADPHAYESKPADMITLSSARLVVYNGGGYDDFFAKLVAG